MTTPIVFFDIAGPKESSLAKFYHDVFGWEIGPDGNFTASVASPTEAPHTIMATIRSDPAEKLLYLGVEDIDAKLSEVVAQGGKIDQPRFEVPGVVVLGLFVDPAGNRMGLVEMEGTVAKVP